MGELRAAVYARASSNELAIANQLAALRVQVVEDEVRLPTEREFVDNGSSGATLARPGLDRLRQLVSAGGIDRLYVQSADRLARMRAHQALLLDEFQAAGIEVVCIDRLRPEPAGMRPPPHA
jgi:site-specific DNA recombinase